MPKQKEVDLGLPPVGHARDEEFRLRNDNLQRAAEEATASGDVGTIPPKVLEPDREICDAISKSYLEIGVNHAYLKTKWVNYVNLHGQKIWEAKAQGWKVATAIEFPEAKDLVREDNTIRIGDVLLMCIRMDEHLKLEERERTKRLRQQFGAEAEIHEYAERANIQAGTKIFGAVHTPGISGMPEHLMTTIEKRAAVRRGAAQHLGNKLKEGLIPGLPVK